MKLETLFADSISAFVHLERYVNDGSPSGYHSSVSRKYSPADGAEYFDLPFFLLPRTGVVRFGDLPTLNGKLPTHWGTRTLFPVHPDIVRTLRNRERIFGSPEFTIPVVPTASGRTVMCIQTGNNNPLFIKLHYPRRLGRFQRDMPLYKWLGAKESASYLRLFVQLYPHLLGMFDEFAGAFLESSSQSAASGFGFVYRDFPLSPRESSGVLVPAFALFSVDRKNVSDPPLIGQLIAAFGLKADDFVELYVQPILRGYSALALRGGLIPEWNAQNLVFEIPRQGQHPRLFARDMEDLWKDLTQRHSLGLDCACTDYHTIHLGNDEDYFKRRSFLFDFKLGEYLLRPLLRAAAPFLGVSGHTLCRKVKKVSKALWAGTPDYFVPRDRWYRYPKKRSVSRARYLAERHPSFR